jgi:K+ potassium transporter
VPEQAETAVTNGYPRVARTASDPQGGESYIVASEELGRLPGLMAAAGLLIDYVMTVAVSIASGVAAITSAYPSMQPATVWIGVGVIVILLTGNLRGVRQAGAVFGVPTYAFTDPGHAGHSRLNARLRPGWVAWEAQAR